MGKQLKIVNESKERIVYWDIVKGITILLVILGHTSGTPVSLRAVIFSFHMPMFFVANAFFIKKYDVRDAFKKSAKSLLKPYLIICCLEIFFAVQRQSDRMGKYLAVLVGLKSMVGGMSKIGIVFTSFSSVWLIWFICCLFISRIVYIAIRQVLKVFPDWVSLCAIVPLAFGGYELGIHQYFLPWSADVALVALIFMWVGDELHKTGMTDKRDFHFIAVMAFFAWILLISKNFWIEMATRSYKGGWICIVSAVFGCIVCIETGIFLSKFEFSASIFSWLGKNSLVILAVHCLECMYFDWSSNFTFAGVSDHYIWIFRFIFRTAVILVITFCYVFCRDYIKKMNHETAAAPDADTASKTIISTQLHK